MFPLQRRLEKLSLTRLIGGHDVAGTVDGTGTNYSLFLGGIRQ
jgi:D-arabinose 1-dehydrogenase-like Zn-dependent alcohol dehydrogenase